MFHEVVFPQYFHVSENIVYLGYLLIIVAYLFFFIHEIYFDTNFTLLVAALLAFGSSVLIDLFWGFAFAEDGAKFIGIIFWATYYFSSVKAFIADRMIIERT
jgi:drug/metabolite transporter (DMT)-like permease